MALAADSAVTFGFGKIRNSADKIFHLSKWQPIGIMLYNSASLWHLPWETIVKYFRATIGRRQEPHLETYAEAFVDFLKSDVRLRKAMADPNRVEQHVTFAMMQLQRGFDNHLKHHVADQPIRDKVELQAVFEQFIRTEIDELSESGTVRTADAAHVSAAVSNLAIAAAFPRMPITDACRGLLHEFAITAVTRVPFGESTGLVFAGYGSDDLVPSLVEYVIAGYADDYLHVERRRDADITQIESCIIPFGQSDVVATFMNGVAPNYFDTVTTAVSKVISNYPKLLLDRLEALQKLDPDDRKPLEKDLRAIGRVLNKRLRGAFDSFQAEEFSDPVLDMVAGSSKSELASIAESLVFLTSVRRQFSRDEESVGGPIDVAVISRGDGFVWIKRKHYFSPELNPQFIRTYYEDASHGGEKKKSDA